MSLQIGDGINRKSVAVVCLACSERSWRRRLTAEVLAQPPLYQTFKIVSQSVVKIDPEIMSGAPRFAATRVPIQNLIDYLEEWRFDRRFPAGIALAPTRYRRRA